MRLAPFFKQNTMKSQNKAILEQETFKPIKGYEGLYEISNKGNVRSMDRIITYSKNISRQVNGRLLKLGINGRGYYMVGLCRNGDCKTFRVHVLVAQSFIGPRPDKMVIDHIDGNQLNNSLSNLRYITQRQNVYRGYKNSKNVYKNGLGYAVRFRINGKLEYFGYFKKEDQAIKKAEEVRRGFNFKPPITDATHATA